MTKNISTPSQQTTQSRRFQRVRFGALVFLALAAVMAFLSKSHPKWFQADFTSDAQMESRSADFEQGLAAQFTKVRGQDSVGDSHSRKRYERMVGIAPSQMA